MAFSRTGSTDCMIPSLLSVSLICGCMPKKSLQHTDKDKDPEDQEDAEIDIIEELDKLQEESENGVFRLVALNGVFQCVK